MIGYETGKNILKLYCLIEFRARNFQQWENKMKTFKHKQTHIRIFRLSTEKWGKI